VLRAFNRRHAGKRIAVEWGIGGLKSKVKKFLGRCGNHRDRLGSMFKTAAILTNFIDRRRQNLQVVELLDNHFNQKCKLAQLVAGLPTHIPTWSWVIINKPKPHWLQTIHKIVYSLLSGERPLNSQP
jgi:hypothetical protein